MLILEFLQGSVKWQEALKIKRTIIKINLKNSISKFLFAPAKSMVRFSSSKVFVQR